MAVLGGFLGLGSAISGNTITEISGGGYVRRAITFTPMSFGNTADALGGTIGPCTGSDWGHIVCVGLFDAAVGGNLLLCWALSSPVYIGVGGTRTDAAGSYRLRFPDLVQGSQPASAVSWPAAASVAVTDTGCLVLAGTSLTYAAGALAALAPAEAVVQVGGDGSNLTTIATSASSARRLADRAADVPSTLDFSGIDPTGNHDSSAALSAWAAEVSANGRGAAVVGRGVYSVSGNITINLPQGSGLLLSGAGGGSVLRFDGAGGLVVNAAPSLDGIAQQGLIAVRDLSLAANVANAGTALTINGPLLSGQRTVPGARIDNVYVDSWNIMSGQCWTGGIAVNDVANFNLARCVINLRSSNGVGISLNYSVNPLTDSVIRDSSFFLTGATGTALAVNAWVEGLHILDNTFVGVGNGIVATTTPGWTRPLLFIRGNYFQAYQAIAIDKYEYITILDNNFGEGNATTNTYTCIYIENSQHATNSSLDPRYILIHGNSLVGGNETSNDVGVNIQHGAQGFVTNNTFNALKTDIILGAATSGILIMPNIHDFEGIQRVNNQSALNIVRTDEDAASALGNFVYNGQFDIWQRGTSSTTSVAAPYYLADRWIPYIEQGTGGSVTQTQQADVPNTQSVYSLMVVQASAAYTGAQFYSVQQRFEVRDARRMANRQLTLSFWYKSSVAGTHNTRFAVYDGSFLTSLFNVVMPFTVATAGVWQNVVSNFGLITPSANWASADNALGAVLEIGFLCGSGTGSGTIAVGQAFQVAQVRLLAGRIQSSMPAGDPGIELQRCQRYFEMTYPSGTLPGAAAATGSALQFNAGATAYGMVDWNYKVRKRAVPNVAYYSANSGASGYVYLHDISNSVTADAAVGNTSTTEVNTATEAQTTTVRGTRASLYLHATADAEL